MIVRATGADMLAALALAACGGGQTGDSTLAESRTGEQELSELEERQQELERQLDRGKPVEEVPDTRTPPRASPTLTPVDIRAFKRFAATLNGSAEIVVGSFGSRPVQLGVVRDNTAWSTIKVPIAVRVLKDAGGPAALPATTRDEIFRALTASDNDAAKSLWNSLVSTYGGPEGAAQATTEVLRTAGDDTTEVSSQGRADFSPYGQTHWQLLSQHRFMASLAAGCVADSATTRYLLDTMTQVIEGQRWGLGTVGRPALYKGGWGPDPEQQYLVRQMGVLHHTRQGGGTVVTLAAEPADGSFDSGTAMLTAMAEWLDERVTDEPARPVAC